MAVPTATLDRRDRQWTITPRFVHYACFERADHPPAIDTTGSPGPTEGNRRRTRPVRYTNRLDARRSIASIAGVAFTLAFPFLDWSRLIGHAHWPGILLKVVSAALLAVIGFLINKRTAGFYQIRGFGWRDVAIAVAGLELHFAAILATADVLAHFEVTGTQSPAAGWGAGPLWFALLAALSAAVSEELTVPRVRDRRTRRVNSQPADSGGAFPCRFYAGALPQLRLDAGVDLSRIGRPALHHLVPVATQPSPLHAGARNHRLYRRCSEVQLNPSSGRRPTFR